MTESLLIEVANSCSPGLATFLLVAAPDVAPAPLLIEEVLAVLPMPGRLKPLLSLALDLLLAEFKSTVPLEVAPVGPIALLAAWHDSVQ